MIPTMTQSRIWSRRWDTHSYRTIDNHSPSDCEPISTISSDFTGYSSALWWDPYWPVTSPSSLYSYGKEIHQEISRTNLLWAHPGAKTRDRNRNSSHHPYLRDVFLPSCWVMAISRCVIFLFDDSRTVGYGDFRPLTDGGKIFTIFYQFIGIPFFVYTTSLFINRK